MRVFCELDPQRQGLHQEGAKVRITRQAEHLALEWWKEKACADTDPTAVWYYHAWTEEGRIAAGFREKQKKPVGDSQDHATQAALFRQLPASRERAGVRHARLQNDASQLVETTQTDKLGASERCAVRKKNYTKQGTLTLKP